MSSHPILVFGLGITGQAALNYCVQHHVPVMAYDDKEKTELVKTLSIPFYFKEFPEREAFFAHGGGVSVLVSKQSDVFNKFSKEWFGDSVVPLTINL